MGLSLHANNAHIIVSRQVRIAAIGSSKKRCSQVDMNITVATAEKGSNVRHICVWHMKLPAMMMEEAASIARCKNTPFKFWCNSQ